MGLFSKIATMLRGNVSPGPAGANREATPGQSTAEATVSISFSGPAGPSAQVSAEEVGVVVERYSFVLQHELGALPTADRWWHEGTHKRRLKEGSEKAFSWLQPFVSVELVRELGLAAAKTEWGPLRAESLAKELRAVVRERRKLKQPHDDVLRALYGACLLADFVDSLLFEGYQPHHMAEFVSATELQAIQIDYAATGYQAIQALGKTDIKWLVDSFGEPAEHQSFNAAYPSVWQNAISRKCWSELAQQQKTAASLGLPAPSLQGWLSELVRRNIGYHKEWRARVDAKMARDAENAASVSEALAATAQAFVVADLETTGLRAAEHDILEFAAVQASADGTVLATYSALVRVELPLPAEIVRLTGISDADVAREGRPLEEALTDFLAFVGERPVFFHNAPFDQGFLKQAAAATKKKFSSPVHDTLPLARKAWPELGGYKLGGLAAHIGAPAPTHRALADARATLAVLLAARATLNG
jgi:DNA polymerase III subunit epsilon